MKAVVLVFHLSWANDTNYYYLASPPTLYHTATGLPPHIHSPLHQPSFLHFPYNHSIKHAVCNASICFCSQFLWQHGWINASPGPEASSLPAISCGDWKPPTPSRFPEMEPPPSSTLTSSRSLSHSSCSCCCSSLRCCLAKLIGFMLKWRTLVLLGS